LIAVLVFGSRARYLLPLLPLVIGGVVVAVRDAARGAGAHWVAAGALVAAGVGGNLALLAQQHGGDTTDVPIVAAAEQLRAGLPGDARAIGTEPRILSYLSRRAVFGVRELPEAREPGALAAGLQRRGIRFVVVPVLERDRYGLRELLAEECIALGPAVVVAGHLEARPITTDPRPCASPAGGGGWLPRTAASPRATSP
jgi:hypothetical protein